MSSKIVRVIDDFKELMFFDFIPVSNYLKGFNQIFSKTSLFQCR